MIWAVVIEGLVIVWLYVAMQRCADALQFLGNAVDDLIERVKSLERLESGRDSNNL